MKNRLKRITALLSVLILGGCTGYDSMVEQNGIRYAVTASGRKAFAADVIWQVSSDPQEITIPDAIDKASVTSLGGFYGTGVPTPFMITGAAGSYDFSTDTPDPSRYGAPIRIETVPFTIAIPDSVTEVRQAAAGGCYGVRTENGEIVFYAPEVSFSCSENHPVFTTDSGMLVSKEDQSPVIENEDFYMPVPEPERTLRDKLLCRTVKDMGDEKEVWDFFPEFGRVFVHINSYMHDSEYVFSAMELIPLEDGILDRTDVDSFDAEIRQFSDFAMAGQYTEPLYPYCRITVQDDDVTFTWIDETKTPVMDSGIQLPKDLTQPSQFAITEEELNRTDPADVRSRPYAGFQAPKLNGKTLEYDNGRIIIYRDGTITIEQDQENTTVVYRGLARTGAKWSDGNLHFAVKKLGGTTEPYFGKVHLEVEDDTVTFTALEGFEHSPLIPEGDDTLVCRIS